MTRRKQSASAILALFAVLATADRPVLAQYREVQAFSGEIGPSNGQIAGAIAGIAAVGAAAGIGIYFAVKHNHSVTGCARSGPEGLQLTSEPDKQRYTLVGEVAGIKPGNRVHVSGKKSKDKSAGTHQFLVEKVSKDLGPCEVTSAVR